MNTLDNMADFIEPKTVAEYLDVNVQTVYSWMAKGDLPYYVFGIRSTKIGKADLVEFIRKSRRNG